MTDNVHGATGAYDEAYRRLNASQRLAVDTIEGPVMVIAGPGTGKTQILTLRIANILRQTDMRPNNILALTFTESGAKAMRERLRRYIGAASYQVAIYTFHGFAAKLIADYPDAYVRAVGGRPVSDLEKIRIIEQVLESDGIKLLRPFGNPVYYVPHITRMIGQLKQEYVTPDIFSSLIADQERELLDIPQFHEKGAHKGKVRGEYTKKEQSIAKNRELLFIYRRYEAMMTDQNFFDFEDMIVETVQALEQNESMLRDLQETYQYILADEHQDVNGSQNKILELLASFHDSPNIFAVGDEKQAIYRFQGASLENFLYFTTQYPTAQIIQLTENYRSGQIILDASHSLVAVEAGPLAALRVPLQAAGITESVAVTQRQFAHQAVEDEWVVQAVAADIARGVPSKEIAVIVRTNREVESIAAMFRKAGIAVTVTAESDVLDHSITHAIESLMRAVVTQSGNEALFELLHGAYWGISAHDLLLVLSAQTYTRTLWDIVSNRELLAEIGVDAPDTFLRVADVLTQARQREVTDSPHRVLEYVLQASGFLPHIIEHDPIEGARLVRRIYDEIESMVFRDGITSIRAVCEALALRRAYNLPITAPYIVTSEDSVQIMTAHKSKGLEFEVVYVPHVHDGGWGGGTKKKYFDIPLRLHVVSDEGDDAVEDERRLLYVAMTRAKRVLSISYAGISIAGRELLPARLLESIDGQYVVNVSTAEAAAAFEPLAMIATPLEPQRADVVLLRTVLQQRGFSATSLNNYLSSPWNYFYRNVLRVPEVQAVHMQFGTAVHAVLEYVARYHTEHGIAPRDTDIRDKLAAALHRLPISDGEYARLFEKGLEALMVYVPHMVAGLPASTKSECKFSVYLPTGIPELPELLLTGNLDRIDFDANGFALRVVDYKTGKPKSRNVIEGHTKDSDGGYKRQLTFYALLLSLYDDERYRCKTGVLSFVEPEKGVIKEESFVITDEEIAELKQVIVQAAGEIIRGEFFSTPVSAEECDYWRMVERWREGEVL